MRLPYFVFGVLALGLTACQPSSNPEIKPSADFRDYPGDSLPLPTEPKRPQRLRLMFIGDIMQHSNQILSAYEPETGSHNYEPSFRYVRPIFAQADYVVGNLELTFNGLGHYTGYPRFRSPDTLGVFLKEAGFDLLLTANNHSNDGDLYGLIHTLDVLDSLGIKRTGTFRDSAERAAQYPLVLDFPQAGSEQSIRLVILNYSYGTNGLPTKKPSVVNLIDTVAMLRDLDKAHDLKPDFLIACMHWGGEYQLMEHKSQKDLAHFLHREGVDLIVGSHPHVVQPIRSDSAYDRRRGLKRPVYTAYSLGNFISNQEQPNTDLGLIWDIILEKDPETGTTHLVEQHYIPVWRFIRFPHKKVQEREYYALPVALLEQDSSLYETLNFSPSQRQAMQSVSSRIRSHLQKQGGPKEGLVGELGR